MGGLKADGSDGKKILVASIVFMGLAHILFLKQYIKGALYAAVEIIMLIAAPTIIGKLIGLVTLGEPKPHLSVKLRDNSIFMMIDGVVIIGVIALFAIAYFISVRGARNEYNKYCITKVLKSNKQSMGDIFGASFPIFALAPTIIMLLFFVVVPLVFSVCVAFTNYSFPNYIPPNNTVDWVGVENFTTLFSGSTSWTTAVWQVALWTIIWGVMATFTCYLGGMAMAIFMQESNIKIKPFFRTIFILPYAVPSVVSLLIWRNLMNGSFGVLNRTLIELGVIKDVIPWLSDPWLARFICVLTNMWAGFPYFMLLIMGTMTAISADIFEAARVDGASRFEVFRNISLPLVLYQTTPLIIMSLSHNFNNFGAIFFLTGGDPKLPHTTTTFAKATDILITWIYDLTVKQMKYHYASVLAIMIFIALAPFAIYNFRRTKAFKEGEL